MTRFGRPQKTGWFLPRRFSDTTPTSLSQTQLEHPVDHLAREPGPGSDPVPIDLMCSLAAAAPSALRVIVKLMSPRRFCAEATPGLSLF